MSTCQPNLTHSFLTVCEIITFKVEKKVFPSAPERDSSVLKAKKTIFRHWYGLSDLKFLFIVELGICVQNLIFTKGLEGCQKNYFPGRGMQKFTYKGHFLTIKIAYEKILGLKIQTVETCSSASSTHINFYFRKTLKS
jgi:hypothetical protein